MTHEVDPEDWSFNGDPATPDEIKDMETTAFEILAGESTEFIRQYSYVEPESGLIAIFQSCILEEESDRGAIVSVQIAQDNIRNIKFGVVYNYDNEPTLGVDKPEDFENVSDSIQILLSREAIDPKDLVVLRYLHSLVNASIISDEPGTAYYYEATESENNRIANLVRSRIKENTTKTIVAKRWGFKLLDGDSVAIWSNEVVGKFEEDEVTYLPKLYINYYDQQNHTLYFYSRSRSGELESDSILVDLDGDNSVVKTDEDILNPDDDIEDQVGEFSMGLRDHNPAKHNVKLITNKLIEAYQQFEEICIEVEVELDPSL